MQDTGIGPALKRARLQRGKSIEEAARETRIRPEYLHALEGERFDRLIGDVYVRGFLRSYSTYLGLNADRVVTVYNRTFGPPRPTLPEPAPGPARSRQGEGLHPHLPSAVRHHPSWAFLIGVALLALVVLGAAGVLSRSRSSPPSEGPVAPQPSITVLPPSVVVTLTSSRPIRATVTADGRNALPGGLIKAGQGLSFEANSRITVRLGRGGLVAVTVNGHDLGKPGKAGRPYEASFGPQDFRASPSSSPSASPQPSRRSPSAASPSS